MHFKHTPFTDLCLNGAYFYVGEPLSDCSQVERMDSIFLSHGLVCLIFRTLCPSPAGTLTQKARGMSKAGRVAGTESALKEEKLARVSGPDEGYVFTLWPNPQNSRDGEKSYRSSRKQGPLSLV